MIRLETRLTRDSANFVTEEDVLVVEIEKQDETIRNCGKESMSNDSVANDSTNESREESSATASNPCDINGPMTISSTTNWSDCTYDSLPDGRARRKEQKKLELEHMQELLAACSVFRSVHSRVDDCYTKNAMKVILNFQDTYTEYLDSMKAIHERTSRLRQRIQDLDDTFERADIRDMLGIPQLQLTAEQLAAIAASNPSSSPHADTSELGQLVPDNRPPLVTRLRAAAEEQPNAEAGAAGLANLLADENAKLAANRLLIERGLAASPSRLFRFGQSADLTSSAHGDEAVFELDNIGAGGVHGAATGDQAECDGDRLRDGRAAPSALAAAAGLLNRIPRILDRSTSMRQSASASSGSAAVALATSTKAAAATTIDPLTGRRWISEDAETPVLRPRLAKLKSGHRDGRRTLTRSKSASEERPKSNGGADSSSYQPSLLRQPKQSQQQQHQQQQQHHQSQAAIRTSVSLSASNSSDGAIESDNRFLSAAATAWRPGNSNLNNETEDNDSADDFEEPGYAYIKDVLPQRQSDSTTATAASLESDIDQPVGANNPAAVNETTSGGRTGSLWDFRRLIRDLRGGGGGGSRRQRQLSADDQSPGATAEPVKRHRSDDCMLMDSPAKTEQQKKKKKHQQPQEQQSTKSNLRRKLSRSLSFFAAPAAKLLGGGSSGGGGASGGVSENAGQSKQLNASNTFNCVVGNGHSNRLTATLAGMDDIPDIDEDSD